MKNLAVIPARSGSKGLKDKNIKLLSDKPLLAYSVEAALGAGLFDTVHVSTDSMEYANIAEKYGADVPFLRSRKNSLDNAGSWDAVIEVLGRYREIGLEFDMVTLLQPTSPLRTLNDIKGAYQCFIDRNANAVVSVCEVDHSPLWCNVLPPDGSMEAFCREEAKGPRQDLPTYYRINGAVYMVKTDYLMEGTDILRKGSFAYKMPRERSVDIDTELDFLMAEFLMETL